MTDEKKKEKQPSVDEKLDVIIHYLHNLDKRDRIRTWGSFVRSTITLIPVLFLIWSVWFLYSHGEELLVQITTLAAQQAAQITGMEASGEVMEQFRLMFPGSAQ